VDLAAKLCFLVPSSVDQRAGGRMINLLGRVRCQGITHGIKKTLTGKTMIFLRFGDWPDSATKP